MEMCANNPKHSIRVVGSYDLLTFFTEDVQKEFFDIITDPGFEKIFSHSDYKNNDSGNFKYSREEYEFELNMTNHGLIRESFWKDSFPPIFTIKPYQFSQIVNAELKNNGGENNESVASLIASSLESLSNRCGELDYSKKLECCIYRYALSKIAEKFKNLECYIHLGLNSFGVANFGLTLYVDCSKNDSFESLCERIYQEGSWFQGDPLKDYQSSESNQSHSIDSPRIFLSYFQVLAIFVIHRFLKEKLTKVIGKLEEKCYCSCISEKWIRKVYALSEYQWKGLPGLLAEPWDISNKVKNSTRFELPPHAPRGFYVLPH